MTVALSAAVMAAGGLIPAATYCAPLLAAAFLLPVLLEFGRGKAWMVWAASAMLSLIVCADKEAAFLYLFLGWYPILQERLELLRARPLRVILKTFLFALALGAMYGLLLYVFRLEAVIADFASLGVLVSAGIYLGMIAVMLIYDRTLVRLKSLYLRKLRPKLRLLIS